MNFDLMRLIDSSNTIRTARLRTSGNYLFPHLFFSMTQYPYSWVSGKAAAVQFSLYVDVTTGGMPKYSN